MLLGTNSLHFIPIAAEIKCEALTHSLTAAVDLPLANCFVQVKQI